MGAAIAGIISLISMAYAGIAALIHDSAKREDRGAQQPQVAMARPDPVHCAELADLQKEAVVLHSAGLTWRHAEESIYRNEYVLNKTYEQKDFEKALDSAYTGSESVVCKP